MKDIHFLNASKEEAEEIYSLYKSKFGTPGCTWSEYYPNMDNIKTDLERGNLFVLKMQEEIIGSVAIDVDEQVDALECWDKKLVPNGELARLVVKDGYENRGLARQLLIYGMEELKKRGMRAVHFLVSETNMKALNSYNKLNFNNKGQCHLYDEHWLCYEKEL